MFMDPEMKQPYVTEGLGRFGLDADDDESEFMKETILAGGSGITPQNDPFILSLI